MGMGYSSLPVVSKHSVAQGQTPSAHHSIIAILRVENKGRPSSLSCVSQHSVAQGQTLSALHSIIAILGVECGRRLLKPTSCI